MRLRSRLYISALSLLALGLFLFALTRTHAPGLERGLLAMVFAALLTLAYLFRLHFAPGTKVTLGTSALFASVLLFDPALAMLVAASGRVAAYALRRGPRDEALLNTSQTVLQAGVGGLLLARAGWQTNQLRFNHPEQLLMLSLAALSMYVVNAFSVAMIVALESDRSALSVWLRSTGAADAAERLPQLVLGLLAAIVADAQPWALPLVLPLGLAIYRLSERHRRTEEQNRDLAHRAFHDPLTGIPNRALLTDRLEHALARAARRRDSVALLALDLDDFKLVNDAYGHEAGDGVLVEVAGRLSAALRPGDTVARLGGDEFVVLLEDILGAGDARRAAERILGEVSGVPYLVGGDELSATASIGVAVSAPMRDGPADLLRKADAALYRAKGAGKARYEVFDSRPGAAAARRPGLESGPR